MLQVCPSPSPSPSPSRQVTADVSTRQCIAIAWCHSPSWHRLDRGKGGGKWHDRVQGSGFRVQGSGFRVQ
eukprot:1663323-Rhodomonas_salina.1